MTTAHNPPRPAAQHVQPQSDRTVNVIADVSQIRLRGFSLQSASPLTVSGASAWPERNQGFEPAFLEVPVIVPAGATHVVGASVSGFVDMHFRAPIPADTVYAVGAPILCPACGKVDKEGKVFYHEAGQCQDEPARPEHGDSGARTAILNPAWQRGSKVNSHATVPQNLLVSIAADGRELYQIGRIDSRTPQTLENVGKLPLGHVFSVAIPEGHRVVWVRFASHRVERLIVLSVSLTFRGAFEAAPVAVAGYVRKARKARTRRARSVVSAPVAQAAELTTRPTVA